jgi:transcriptional regulator with XRE-family HTH domain
MDDGAAALASVIGARVKSERQARGWTLDQLAQAAAVSRRMVVSVEKGEVNPSVGTLLRLGEALGVGLPALVEPPQSQAVKITRRGEGATLWTGPAGGQGILVAGTATPEVIELWDWTLAGGESRTRRAPGSWCMSLRAP